MSARSRIRRVRGFYAMRAAALRLGLDRQPYVNLEEFILASFLRRTPRGDVARMELGQWTRQAVRGWAIDQGATSFEDFVTTNQFACCGNMFCKDETCKTHDAEYRRYAKNLLAAKSPDEQYATATEYILRKMTRRRGRRYTYTVVDEIGRQP